MQKIKLYSLGLVLLTLIFGVCLLVFIQNISPNRLGNILLFYLLAGAFVFSLCTLLAFYLRKALGQREMLNYYLFVSAREGIWLAIIFVVSLFLLNHKFFTWINAVLLVLTFIFLESYLLTKNDRKS